MEEVGQMFTEGNKQTQEKLLYKQLCWLFVKASSSSLSFTALPNVEIQEKLLYKQR